MKSDSQFTISGHIVDIVRKKIFRGTLAVGNGRILSVKEERTSEEKYILPGLIDSHIHVESSMLVPSEFARMAVVHGTVATVSDPHEIANVLGLNGVLFMITNGKKVPFKFYFGAPSCVPATPFETAGASIGLSEIDYLLQMDEVKYLSEMMNFPGVLNNDKVVMDKIALAVKYNKPVDGHSPGVTGPDAQKYIGAGISTDHECYSLEEALDKIGYGMKILIREGSAAKNFEELSELINLHPDKIMFCSDDKHPNDLQKGHMNALVKRAIAKGYDPITVLRSCVYNPVQHYNLHVGLLQPGDPADFILINNLTDFKVLGTYITGIKVAENGTSLIKSISDTLPNCFTASRISVEDLQIQAQSGMIRIQKAIDGQLITGCEKVNPKVVNGLIVSDTDRDILKMTVINRYIPSKPAVNFIHGFGLKRGAIASSVAHDSHNVIALGTNDEDIVSAVNMVIGTKGGIALADSHEKLILPLPVAGLMSENDGNKVAELYDMLDKKAKALGSVLHAPYMTLSFMALLVIPELKLSDKGLFDGKKFTIIDLFSN
ncbi:MAG: adenine deaminase [Bacteroidetes bacterium]|nr:adenine deaminase [Bacteroidota bacterium]